MRPHVVETEGNAIVIGAYDAGRKGKRIRPIVRGEPDLNAGPGREEQWLPQRRDFDADRAEVHGLSMPGTARGFHG